MSPDKLIAEYQAAFAAANPGAKPYGIFYDRGWYRMARRGVIARYRRKEIEQMIGVLRSRVPA
jgi:hypothetical protein